MSGEKLLAKSNPTSSFYLASKQLQLDTANIVLAMIMAIGEKTKEVIGTPATVFPRPPLRREWNGEDGVPVGSM